MRNVAVEWRWGDEVGAGTQVLGRTQNSTGEEEALATKFADEKRGEERQ